MTAAGTSDDTRGATGVAVVLGFWEWQWKMETKLNAEIRKKVLIVFKINIPGQGSINIKRRRY